MMSTFSFISLSSIFGEDKNEHGRVYSWPDTKAKLIHSFSNPILVTDTHKISLLSPTVRDSLFELFRYPKVTTYGGISLSFSNKYVGVWGPSIDTILVTKALSKIDLSGVRAAVEIGAGSGFIAKYVLAHSKLDTIQLIDLNRFAMDCWKDNIDDNRARFFIGDAMEIVEGKKYDLIVCNPPYIPRPKSIDDNPYEGVGLIAFLIQNAKNLLNPGGKLVLNLSSLCMDIVQPLLEENGVAVKKIVSMTVPLKVYNVLNNDEWMSYLVDRGLEINHRDGYDYWQEIMVYEMTVD